MFDDGVLMDQASFPPVDATVRDAMALAQVSPVALTSQAALANPMATPVAVDAQNFAQMAAQQGVPSVVTVEPVNLEQAVKVSEHQVIMAAIQSTESRIEAAAKLGISPRTLRYKIAQLREMGLIEGVAA
jgi:two-component system response regulator FlrC